ncbi:MAG TPA: type II toxin-antitoxin system VapC family toxin [Acidobacteriaceae bacterium]|jgi:ribonuclease VapC
MVVDTSIVIAIMLQEAGSDSLISKINDADVRGISVVSYMEASMVLIARRGDGVEAELDRLLHEADIAILPVDEMQAKIAREAFRVYGKGRHPAGLNFGDCFAYALAQSLSEPLFFKGDDFTQTDMLRVQE